MRLTLVKDGILMKASAFIRVSLIMAKINVILIVIIIAIWCALFSFRPILGFV